MHRPGKLAGFHWEQNIACICQRILHARDPKHTDQVKVKSQQKAFANSDYQTFAIHMHTIKTIPFWLLYLSTETDNPYSVDQFIVKESGSILRTKLKQKKGFTHDNTIPWRKRQRPSSLWVIVCRHARERMKGTFGRSRPHLSSIYPVQYLTTYKGLTQHILTSSVANRLCLTIPRLIEFSTPKEGISPCQRPELKDDL